MSAAPQPLAYFCHQCNHTVTLTPTPNSDLACPICHGGFLEELEVTAATSQSPSLSSRNPNPSPTHTIDPFAAFNEPLFAAAFGGSGATRRGPVLISSTTIDLENPRNFSDMLVPDYQDPHSFNPLFFLRSHLQNLRAGGANVQFVIEHQHADGGSRLPANIGDYFLGQGLEQVIQQLAENDPNRYGTPPASRKAVEGLPDVKITNDLVKSDSAQCSVCMDDFKLGAMVKQLPCKHLFHSECILPWLELHNTCPVCRYELPTDDQDYENRQGRGNHPRPRVPDGGRDAGDEGQANSQRPRTAERRFRISLPWPFNLGRSGGNNNAGGTGNDNNSSSGADPTCEDTN